MTSSNPTQASEELDNELDKFVESQGRLRPFSSRSFSSPRPRHEFPRYVRSANIPDKTQATRISEVRLVALSGLLCRVGADAANAATTIFSACE